MVWTFCLSLFAAYYVSCIVVIVSCKGSHLLLSVVVVGRRQVVDRSMYVGRKRQSGTGYGKKKRDSGPDFVLDQGSRVTQFRRIFVQ